MCGSLKIESINLLQHVIESCNVSVNNNQVSNSRENEDAKFLMPQGPL